MIATFTRLIDSNPTTAAMGRSLVCTRLRPVCSAGKFESRTGVLGEEPLDITCYLNLLTQIGLRHVVMIRSTDFFKVR